MSKTWGPRALSRLLSAILIVLGVGLVLYATTLPVYTDPSAPERISNQLEPRPNDTGKDVMEARFHEWHAQLRSYETAHKRLSDLGRGLGTAGLGLLLTDVFFYCYHRYRWMRTVIALLICWVTLWAMRLPLSVWYYGLRQQRFDYPVWGDSIGIGIFEDWCAWTVGAAMSSVFLMLLLRGYKLSAEISLVRPASIYGWMRAVLLACWIAFLVVDLFFGIPGGDEGAVLTDICASAILLTVLSAERKENEGKTPAAAIAEMGRTQET